MVQIVGVQKPPQVYVVRLLHVHFGQQGELLAGTIDSSRVHEDDPCCLPVYGIDESLDSHVLDSLCLSELNQDKIQIVLDEYRIQKLGQLSYRLMLNEGESFERFREAVQVGSAFSGRWNYVKVSDKIERSISYQAARRKAIYMRKN